MGEDALVQGTVRPHDTIIASGVHRLVAGQLVDPIEIELGEVR